jgi:kinesin family protein 26
MLRVTDSAEDKDSCLLIDRKKRQVTFTEPVTQATATSSVQDRAIMVSAPKMFAFDGLFTDEDCCQVIFLL